jgi:hypothetical protein
MSDENQILIPASFTALFVARGRSRPDAPRAVIAARYDLCEDMAQMLTEHARTMLFSLGLTEDVVLERIHRGLCAEDAALGRAEAGWVTRRLAELLDWPAPARVEDDAS